MTTRLRSFKELAFGTTLMVRAEVVRVVGSHTETGHHFRQKVLDRMRGRESYEFGNIDEWPGVAVPADWADTPTGWPLEPSPNGDALTRWRRIPSLTPQIGIYVGHTQVFEGTLAKEENCAGRLQGKLNDRRRLQLYEIALTPGRSGLAHLILVHPLDATVLPQAHERS